MKKLSMAIFMLSFALSTTAQNGWTPVPKEIAEKQAIMLQVAQIKEKFAGMGSSSAEIAEIFEFLKNVGTSASYKILQELVASGELPKWCLGAA